MSRTPAPRRLKGQRFPRVSGDEPGTWGDITAKSEFSPRERG